jgi:hypothetical protein
MPLSGRKMRNFKTPAQDAYARARPSLDGFGDPTARMRPTRGPELPEQESSRQLFLAMADLGPHASLFATELAAALACLFGAHARLLT